MSPLEAGLAGLALGLLSYPLTGLVVKYKEHKAKTEPRTVESIPVEEGFAVKPPSPDEAAVIDPEDPPKQVYYRPAHYDVATAPVCSCHGRPLRYGEASIIWPIKDHPEGAKDLFCSETLALAKGEVFGE